jgi:hypothetical protein
MEPTQIIGISILSVVGVLLLGLAVTSIKNPQPGSRSDSFSDRQPNRNQPRYEYTNTGRNSIDSDDTFYTAVGDETRGGTKRKKPKTITKKYNKNK